jgi:hypothetical protein
MTWWCQRSGMWPHRSRPLVVVQQPRPGDTVLDNFDADDDFVFMWGTGRLDLTCGYCGRLLVRNVLSTARVSGLCLTCPTCASYNQAPEFS